ncbi:MAG: MotA/TolQ/ExbB proton channel family protein [Mariniblastus sp.]
MKRSTSWIAVLPSLVIPVCLGMTMYLGLSYLIKEGTISNELVLRYLTGHPVSEVTVVMFLIGIASLAIIGKNVFDQFRSSKIITIKTAGDKGGQDFEILEAETIEATHDKDVGDRAIRLGKSLLEMPRSVQEHYLWQRLVNSLHSIYRTNSTSSVEEELKYLADLDLDRQEQRYSLVRILIWATPMLGFLGTVLGISQALGGINVGPDNNFPEMMNGLRSSLYVAFDTTALALTLSMVLMFCQFLVDRFESQLLVLVQYRAKSEISSQFDLTTTNGESAFQKVANELLLVTKESVKQQTETWRQSIRSAEQAWTASLTDVNQQVQTNLSDALDENVSNLAHYLSEAIEKADLAMSHRWEQWQVTLSSNAQLMSRYQQDLADQTISIKDLVAQSASQERFDSAIERSQEAMEQTAKLQHSLSLLMGQSDQLQSPGPLEQQMSEQLVSDHQVVRRDTVSPQDVDQPVKTQMLQVFDGTEAIETEDFPDEVEAKAISQDQQETKAVETEPKLPVSGSKGNLKILKASERSNRNADRPDVILPIRSSRRRSAKVPPNRAA